MLFNMHRGGQDKALIVLCAQLFLDLLPNVFCIGI